MNSKQLRNSILQMAIQGKLVPQDPNDEPASVLLEKILQEKKRLVKEGVLKKKDLEETPISDDEKPFDIPESWEWCRIGDVFTMQAGMNVPTGSIKDVYNQDNPYPCMGGNGIRGFVSNYNIEGVHAVMGRQGALCGNINLSPEKFYATEHAVVVSNYAGTDLMWTYYSLTASNLNQYATATAQPGLSVANILKVLYPLPPLAEQHRIVAKLEEILPIVDEYGKAQEEANKLHDELPNKLRKSILQEAIQGKLVPQDPNDEPASVLLEKILQEKKRLVKEGVLKKKDLEETPISDDEKPFDIPESWEWCRLKFICSKIVDGDHNPPSGISSKTKYLMLSSKNINNDRLVNLEDVRYLSKEMFEKEDLRTTARKNDILFTSVGSIGRSCILRDESLNLCFQRSVSILTTFVFNEFLKRYLDSPFIQSYINEYATGTAQKGFYLKQMETLLVAIPPLAEQHRIVAKIEELFNELK